MLSSLKPKPALLFDRRKFKDECGAYASFALHFDLAMMILYDGMDDEESEPGSFSGLLCAVERLEYPVEIFFGDSRTSVLERNMDMIANSGGLNNELASLVHGLLGIQDKVDEYLLKTVGIAHDRREVVGQIEGGFHPGHLDLGA